jgi:hypothetical protein
MSANIEVSIFVIANKSTYIKPDNASQTPTMATNTTPEIAKNAAIVEGSILLLKLGQRLLKGGQTHN